MCDFIRDLRQSPWNQWAFVIGDWTTFEINGTKPHLEPGSVRGTEKQERLSASERESIPSLNPPSSLEFMWSSCEPRPTFPRAESTNVMTLRGASTGWRTEGEKGFVHAVLHKAKAFYRLTDALPGCRMTPDGS